ncbi:hypothetical protein [Streptomyces sp. NPDC005435]|uniref:hypothetical protein n=1 Tax=Streptomyces sp. NPDC005435 TaxID=3154464 RepID=UPI003454271B
MDVARIRDLTRLSRDHRHLRGKCGLVRTNLNGLAQRKPSRRAGLLLRSVRPGIALAAALCSGFLLCALSACSSSPTAAPSRGGNGVPHWVPKTTPQEVADRLHVAVPPKATDLRAAYQDGPQDDGLLLAFVLPGAETPAFLKELAPENPLSHRAEPLLSADEVKPATPFARLGLKEPEALPDVTEGPVCGPCEDDLNSLSVSVHPLDAQRDQVYLRGVD